MTEPDQYNEFDEIEEESEETKPHFFCKLTFGQFFTLMVLEIITLSFVFYLGARYGNEYLKLDVLTESRREPVTIVKNREEEFLPGDSADELRGMAREALKGDDNDLKKRVKEILSRQQQPGTPPLGETAYSETGAALSEEEDARIEALLAARRGDMPAPDLPDVAGMPSSSHEMRQVGDQDAEAPVSNEVVKVKSGSSQQFAVQVGSYPDVKEASYRVEEWKAKGYPAYMTIANLGDKGQWYRVRIGGFTDKSDAGKYLDQLASKEGIEDAFVVKNEQ